MEQVKFILLGCTMIIATWIAYAKKKQEIEQCEEQLRILEVDGNREICKQMEDSIRSHKRMKHVCIIFILYGLFIVGSATLSLFGLL